jgi:predicted MFS family arabinose efflux permease
MRSITSSPSTRRLFILSIVARLPLATLSIALLVRIQHLTASFAQAGMVSGTYAVALGVGGPLLGRLIDRRGQTTVLVAAATLTGALLGVIGFVPAHTPLPVLAGLAAGIGLAEPPIGACLRTRLPALMPDPDMVRTAFAFEATVVEVAWVVGPPLVLGVGALWSPGGALAMCGAILLVATIAFALQPASRAWRPIVAVTEGPRRSTLGTPAMRILVIVLLAVGVMLGADEVAVTAVAKSLNGTTAGAAPLLALWGAGSFAGGLLVTRLGGGARTMAGLAGMLAMLTLGHLALIPAQGSVGAFGAVLFLAGAAISPTEAALNAMVDHAAPAGTVTEAFAWLGTAMAVGGALGAAGAGSLTDLAGPTGAFALAGGAGAVAVMVALVGARSSARPACLPPEGGMDRTIHSVTGS